MKVPFHNFKTRKTSPPYYDKSDAFIALRNMRFKVWCISFLHAQKCGSKQFDISWKLWGEFITFKTKTHSCLKMTKGNKLNFKQKKVIKCVIPWISIHQLSWNYNYWYCRIAIVIGANLHKLMGIVIEHEISNIIGRKLAEYKVAINTQPWAYKIILKDLNKATTIRASKHLVDLHEGLYLICLKLYRTFFHAAENQ